MTSPFLMLSCLALPYEYRPPQMISFDIIPLSCGRARFACSHNSNRFHTREREREKQKGKRERERNSENANNKRGEIIVFLWLRYGAPIQSCSNADTLAKVLRLIPEPEWTFLRMILRAHNKVDLATCSRADEKSKS